jgi:RHS repeat-associated protein
MMGNIQQVADPTGTYAFKYDPFGRRIYKQWPSFTGIFVYDGPNLIETLNASGAEVSSYTQQMQSIDEPLAEVRGSTTDYYEADGLGSITSLSTSAAALSNTYTYDSFGNTTNFTGTLRNPFSYTAREFDQETGLYEYRARYYDQTSGRFISEDPLGYRSDDLDFYRYVHASPVNYTDPSGLKTYDCGAGCGFRIERDPHKGLHINWWCNGLEGCLLFPSMKPCEVGRSDTPPNRIKDCIREKLRIRLPDMKNITLPCGKTVQVLTWTTVIAGTGYFLAEYGWLFAF